MRLEWSEMMTNVSQTTRTATIRFSATLDTIDTTTVLRLPHKASRSLPSRGQVAVQGSISGHEFRTVLEPDGTKGHWMRLDQALRQAAHVSAGDRVNVTVEVAPDWPEPEVPPDLTAALESAPRKIKDIWDDITPMARWEWVRWVNATASPATRQRRVEVTISKMNNGKRRPCCFDLSACTDPALAKNGKLRSTTSSTVGPAASSSPLGNRVEGRATLE
ncbi:MAG: YdeI/OmpD-associated family protein [Jatrophihabitantaceae bacterium]